MSAGALHSDHINYLILRYLQEKGHESAATAFYSDWHRPPEYRNPESLPFAHVVRRDELISVIQEGLHHDELSARVRKNQRRFQWTGGPATPPDLTDRPNGAVLENGTARSRPSSSAARKKVRSSDMRAPPDFPTPAPKRQRRSEGSDATQVNGDRDAMDVDAASASADADADADDDGEAASPAVASPEPEIIEVPERYDSMDVATQTDVKSGIKTSTAYWKIDRPGASILHSMWNPSPDPKNSHTLLTVGESLCRFNQVPEEMQDDVQVLSVDEPSMPPNTVVTASTWHPAGNVATCALNTIRHLPDSPNTHSSLIDHSRDSGSSSKYLDLPLLQPPGIVLGLHYSDDGKYILVVRTNQTRGLVVIYDTSHPESGSREPIAWKIFKHQILDAAWVMDDTFVAGGSDSSTNVFRIDPTQRTVDVDLTAETVGTQGLVAVNDALQDYGMPRWDKLRYERHSNILATACLERRALVTQPGPQLSEGETSPQHKIPHLIPGNLTALAFQPPPRADQQARRADKSALLALAMEEGTCVILNVGEQKRDELCTLDLADGPALALAWSPNGGDHLAVGGTELVQIWRVSDLASSRKPLVTWRPDSVALAPQNGEQPGEKEDEQPFSEPSLSWNADGTRLAFTHERQVAVIHFRPPLTGGPAHVETANATRNGHAIS